MTKDELTNKLSDIEWEDFEVKEANTKIPKNTWETVSAFSNTAGGWLIFGVRHSRENFKIIGVENPEKTEQNFTTTLRGDKFNIKIRPISRKFDFPEGTVLAFYIPLSNKKPIYFNTPLNTFIRTASGDQRTTKEETDAMYRDQAFGTRTSAVIPDYDITALHNHSIERYRDYMSRFNPAHAYNKLTKEELLEKTQVIQNGKATQAGLLLFGKNDIIQKIFTDFRIDLLEIPGTSYSDSSARYTYRMEEQENLWEYYFTAFSRLRQRVDLPFKMGEEGFAIENYPYLEALREALVNMLMHTDYHSPAKPRIRVFDNRIEFYNPGGLPVSLEKLMKTDTSMPRNPVLAKSFRAVKLAENAGFGFDKMIDGWKTYKNCIPEFDIHIDTTIVTFPLPSSKPHDNQLPADDCGRLRTITDEPSSDTGEKPSDQRRIPSDQRRIPSDCNEQEKMIIEYIYNNGSIKSKDIETLLNIKESRIRELLRKLVAKEYVERQGKARNTFYILKKKTDIRGTLT